MALFFDGIDNNGHFGQDASIDNFDIKSFLCFADYSWSGNETIIKKEDVGSPFEGWWFVNTTSNLRFNQSRTVARSRRTLNAALSPGLHQLGFTYDGSGNPGGDPIIYVDNAVPAATQTTTGDGTIDTDDDTDLYIGTSAAGSDPADGVISNVVYVNRVLTPAEVNYHFWHGCLINGTDELNHPLMDGNLSKANSGPATAPLIVSGGTVAASLPRVERRWGNMMGVGR